jgi:hypothetical protein
MPESPSTMPEFASFLDEIPNTMRAAIRDGVRSLGGLTDEQLRALAGVTLEAMRAPDATPPSAVSKLIGVPEDTATALVMMSMSLASGSLSNTPTKQIVNSLRDHRLIEDSDNKKLATLLEELARRSVDFQALARLRSTTDAVLPSFRSLETTVDVRLRFEDDAIVLAVPVVVAMLRTDSVQQRLWFQLSKVQVESLIKELQSALKQMEKAEQWSQRPVRP